ncbi:DUF1499 domain-containing protein [uncultured Endozoicomonas sp.]|uniref:DUF1499 domain-containing protein n=1 Tax=uncultured Endozoicomonas sp. TaxID=432652 RepID=UPI0026071790|nr:DUF1499 domain-containing protein [uncultured Endozoicomonas sp.]
MSTKIRHLVLTSLLLTPLLSQAYTDGLPCPESPNCVSSLVEGQQFIAPFMFKESDKAKIHNMLVNALKKSSNIHISGSNGHIIHAVHTSQLLKFEDDIILLINEDGRVDVKSASRVGYYDFGANRRQIESLRQHLKAELVE